LRDDPSVIALVSRANSGDRGAWNEIVERYAPLVWSICGRYRLSRADADDVGQGVWLRLVEHLPTLRNPAALPGWLVTTTRRECLRVLRGRQRREIHEHPLVEDIVEGAGSAALDQELLVAERNAVLRAAFAQLSLRCQQLLSMLLRDPPVPYAEISTSIGIPVGSIGPNRVRCLEALRRRPVLAALIAGEARPEGDRGHAQRVDR
jgi:RNA polymerase sigma factor (sigma-70 family)